MDAEDNPSEWPSIVLDDALHLSESAAVVENLDAPLLPYEEQVQEDDAIQMTASLSLDQSSVSEKKVLDSLSSSNASEQEIADQDGDLVIPDLPLALEPVVKQDQSKDDEPLSDDLASVDISLELGELRFAEEGD